MQSEKKVEAKIIQTFIGQDDDQVYVMGGKAIGESFT